VHSISVSGSCCALLDDRTVKCWGKNQYGSLGDGSNVDTAAPTVTVNFGTTLKILKITSDGGDSYCVLFENGDIKCWGQGSYGLGMGDRVARSSPTAFFKVDWDPIVELVLSPGARYACAMTKVGKLKCWGYNGKGELAVGSTTGYLAAPSVASPFSSFGALPACFRTNYDPPPVCEACLSGSFADVVGLSECKQCTAGTFGSAVAAASENTCENCPLNTYSEVSGSADCTACPGTEITEETGANSVEQCITKCEIGSGFDESSGACVPCAPGTYSDTFDAYACRLCPSNTFSTAVAATTASTCTNCTNSISPAGSSHGTDCICTGGYARYPFSGILIPV
jgi:hypothetical protein